jgi:hypothetical protein
MPEDPLLSIMQIYTPVIPILRNRRCLVMCSVVILPPSVADPDLGSGAFLTPGSWMGKKQDPDPG